MATKRLIVDLDVALHRRLKEKAAREGKTISDVIRELVLQYLKK